MYLHKAPDIARRKILKISCAAVRTTISVAIRAALFQSVTQDNTLSGNGHLRVRAA
jgi:hypothetical protein